MVDPIVRPAITKEELEALIEAAKFTCPLGRRMEACDGSGCPTRKDDPCDDHYGRCCDSLAARLKLGLVRRGEVRVQGLSLREARRLIWGELKAKSRPYAKYLKRVERALEGLALTNR